MNPMQQNHALFELGPSPQIARVLEVFFSTKSERTIEAYRHDLADFAAFLKTATAEEAVEQLLGGGNGKAHELVQMYQGRMKRTAAPTTINRRLATLTSLARTAQALGIIDWRLAPAPIPTMRLRDVAGPGRENVRRMLAATRGQGGEKGARDTAILLLFYGLALRRREVIELDVEHVDIKGAALSILAKRRAEREWVDLPPRVQESLAEYLAISAHEADGPLFFSMSRSHRGQRLTASGVYRLVQEIGRRVGCDATPHGLRHTAITDAILAGHPLPNVQKFSRHAGLDTLQVYYDRARGVQLEVGNSLVFDL